MARQRPTVVLVPSEVVDFSSGSSSIAYHNLSSRQAVAFRVLFTSPDLLTAMPAEGMVPPGKHVEIILTPVDSSESSHLPHRVIVRTLAVPSQLRTGETAPLRSGGQLSPLNQLWASAGTDGTGGVEEHLLSCVRRHAPTGSVTAALSAASDVRLLAQPRGESRYGVHRDRSWNRVACESCSARYPTIFPSIHIGESSAEALLAACERLLLLRTSQLAAAEHALVAERNAAAVTCKASTSTSASSAAATTAAAAAAGAGAGAAPSAGEATGEPPSLHAAAISLRRPPGSHHRPRCAPLVSHLLIGVLGLALGLAFYPLSPAWQLVPRSCRSPSSQELELCWAPWAGAGADQRDLRLDQGAGLSGRTAAWAKAAHWGRFRLGTRAPWASRADAARRGDEGSEKQKGS